MCADVLGPTQTEKGPKHIYAQENKNWKKWQQNSLNNIFFTSAVRKRQQTLKWLFDFDWLLRSYDYLILIFYWFIWAG